MLEFERKKMSQVGLPLIPPGINFSRAVATRELRQLILYTQPDPLSNDWQTVSSLSRTASDVTRLWPENWILQTTPQRATDAGMPWFVDRNGIWYSLSINGTQNAIVYRINRIQDPRVIFSVNASRDNSSHVLVNAGMSPNANTMCIVRTLTRGLPFRNDLCVIDSKFGELVRTFNFNCGPTRIRSASVTCSDRSRILVCCQNTTQMWLLIASPNVVYRAGPFNIISPNSRHLFCATASNYFFTVASYRGAFINVIDIDSNLSLYRPGAGFTLLRSNETPTNIDAQEYEGTLMILVSTINTDTSVSVVLFRTLQFERIREYPGTTCGCFVPLSPIIIGRQGRQIVYYDFRSSQSE